MSKAELVRAMQAEQGRSVSHAYLSQLEGGARIHLSAGSRDLLARFFKVHPGYLVDDPPGYQTEIASAALLERDSLTTWLANRAQEQQHDPVVYRVLLRLSRLDDPRRYLAVMDDLLDEPIEWLEELAPNRSGSSANRPRPARADRRIGSGH